MIETDVLVVGAGPAGSTAAFNLAPTWRVVMIERSPDVPPRIGESLVPAARRLLADMGLMRSFEAEPHIPCYGNRSVWGTAKPVDTDFLRGPDGPGWHLDRARFDAWLRVMAISRGARLIAPARIVSLARSGDGWQVSAATRTERLPIIARMLIDAGGRAAPLARQLGANRRMRDRLVCGWIHGQAFASAGAGLSYVEAVREGWWYTAPLPQGRRVLAFHTDADLASAAIARDRDAMLAHVARANGLAELFAGAGFAPEGNAGFTAAHSTHLEPCAGRGWLAAGDAALSLDPLSSQGLFNALFTGLAAAEAADRHLGGSASALTDYARAIHDIRSAYDDRLAFSYRAETRWPDSPFWRRRHAHASPEMRRARVPINGA